MLTIMMAGISGLWRRAVLHGPITENSSHRGGAEQCGAELMLQTPETTYTALNAVIHRHNLKLLACPILGSQMRIQPLSAKVMNTDSDPYWLPKAPGGANCTRRTGSESAARRNNGLASSEAARTSSPLSPLF